MALTFITWLWGYKYSTVDVAKLAAGIRRNLKQESRFVVFTDQQLVFDPQHKIEVAPIKDTNLALRNCFCRLRMFDPEWQKLYGFEDRIINIDLDVIITGSLDKIFDRQESFVIIKGLNAINPNPFNCSLMMLRPGNHSEVWSNFSLEAANKVPFHEFPDDQGWVWHKLPNAAVWKAGPKSGIYGFQKPGWPAGNALPLDARMVIFVGWRKPQAFIGLPWVVKYWRV